jgi:NAD-dependent SIR2 family protein deacetylase
MAPTDHPIRVSPGLHRPGLDPGPAPEPALHLRGSVWTASCPTCGYQLATARTQQRVEHRAARRTCPVCRNVA